MKITMNTEQNKSRFQIINPLLCMKSQRKWEYMVNITMSIFFIKEYIIKRKGGDPPDLEHLIAKQIEPIRPERNFTRNVKSQPYVSFGYRFS